MCPNHEARHGRTRSPQSGRTTSVSLSRASIVFILREATVRESHTETAMERLISSPLHLTRAPSAPRSFAPPTLPHRPGGLRLLPPLLHCRRPPVLAAASVSSRSLGDEPADEAPVDGGRRFFQKVASAAAVTLVSALILAVIQPAAMAPAALAHGHSAVTVTSRSIFKSELLGSAWTGFLAGCLHTLSGPDHLAALAPLSIGRSRVESAAVGALWGCGHDAGQVIFGLLFLSLKDRLHIEVIRTWGTRVVGLTLLVIGAIGIREATQAPTPCVGHHNSLDQALLSGGGGKKKEMSFATFATGIVHGLQPDALMIILPALALPSRVAGAAFLGMFLVGTVLSMSSYTVLIGSCTEALRERVPRITEKLTWAASLVAISMGLAIIFSQSLGYSLY